jgi:GTP cyclohydrolase II
MGLAAIGIAHARIAHARIAHARIAHARFTDAMYADLHNEPPHPIDDAALRSVDRALAALRRGEMVTIQGRDGRSGLAMALEAANADTLAHLGREAGVPPRLVVTRRRAMVLGLVDVRDDEATGAMVLDPPGNLSIEVARALGDPEHQPAGRPDAAASDGGELEGAAVMLARLARLLPSALVAPVRGLRGGIAGWAARRDLLIVQAGDIADYRIHAVRTLRRVAEAKVPLDGAEDARIVAFRPADGGPEHLAIVIGAPDASAGVLTRLHSECFTGDLLASLRCDCGDQLRGAIRDIASRGAGVLLYLAQEGRGIGLVNKLRAYRLQDRGFDTIDANEMLGFEADERVYLPAAEMLHQLGFQRVRLMTNNPDKLRQLARCGVEVIERVPHVFPSNGHNAGYLRTKAERSGHMF